MEGKYLCVQEWPPHSEEHPHYLFNSQPLCFLSLSKVGLETGQLVILSVFRVSLVERTNLAILIQNEQALPS